MTPELYELVTREGGMIDLSARAKFRVTGNDRLRYINGQITNDVMKASAEKAVYACVTDAKGRISGDVMIHALPEQEALMVDAEEGLRETILKRLDRYIVSDDVVIEDVTDQWLLWHVFGSDCSRAQSVVEDLPEGAHLVADSPRLARPGVDLWLPQGSHRPDVACPMLSSAEFETWRICQGIPRFPHELHGEVFPPEAGLEDRAMDFVKGCYIGQEVLSRIRTTRKMPRQLIAWEAAGSGEEKIEPHDSLFLPAADGGQASPRVVGVVTSVATHPVSEKVVGLGFIKLGSMPEDSVLLVGKDAPRIGLEVKISPLVN